MTKIENLTEFIITLCEEHSLYVEESSNGKFRIFTGHTSGITIFLKIKCPNDFTFYFLERSNDILYNGDRTDVHVVMSLMFACFLRAFDSRISSSLLDIAHPVVDNEVWGRYIIPEQVPSLLGVSTWEQLTEVITKIIMTVAFWKDVFGQLAGCPCHECLKKIGLENNFREYELPKEMMHSENKFLKSTSRLYYGFHHKPNWSYFYDITHEITVIKLDELSSYFEHIQNTGMTNVQKVEGINGKLILQDELENFIPTKRIKEFKKIKRALGNDTSPDEKNILTLENMVLCVSKPYNIALKGVAEHYSDKGKHIITVTTEHYAVLNTYKHLETKGYEVTYLPVLKDGLIDLAELKNSIREDTILVCVMYVNNETGVIQPIKEISSIAHEADALFMTDATQASGKIEIDVDALGIDLLCLSGHKIYAPKGIGALYVRQRINTVKLPTFIHGGGHERDVCSGTLNVPGIIALAKACEIAQTEMNQDSERISALRDELENELLKIEGSFVNGNRENRIFNTTNICFPNVDANVLIGRMKNIAVSNSYACTSAVVEPSHVLTEMGLSEDEAFVSIRFSLGRYNTKKRSYFSNSVN